MDREKAPEQALWGVTLKKVIYFHLVERRGNRERQRQIFHLRFPPQMPAAVRTGPLGAGLEGVAGIPACTATGYRCPRPLCLPVGSLLKRTIIGSIQAPPAVITSYSYYLQI